MSLVMFAVWLFWDLLGFIGRLLGVILWLLVNRKLNNPIHSSSTEFISPTAKKWCDCNVDPLSIM